MKLKLAKSYEYIINKNITKAENYFVQNSCLLVKEKQYFSNLLNGPSINLPAELSCQNKIQ